MGCVINLNGKLWQWQRQPELMQDSVGSVVLGNWVFVVVFVQQDGSQNHFMQMSARVTSKSNLRCQ
eukprot:gene272-3647_t